MPGRKCSVFNCRNSTVLIKKEGTRKSFFSFPKEENLRKKWLEFCQCKIDSLVNARICSDHFTEDDYCLPDSNKKRLKADVVPSQNPSDAEFKESSNKKSTPKSFILEKSRVLIRKKIISGSINPKGSVKKKSVKKKSGDIHSLTESKRKNIRGIGNNIEIKKQQLKRKSSMSNGESKSSQKRKVTKSDCNKENTKGIIKKSSSTEIDSDLPNQKNIKDINQEISKEMTRKKNGTIDSDDNVQNVNKDKILRRSIDGDKSVDIEKNVSECDKDSSINISEKKNDTDDSNVLLKKNINLEYDAGDSSSLTKLKMETENIPKENWKMLPKKLEKKDSDKCIISGVDNIGTDVSTVNLKQPLKRKSSLIKSKKLFKKRIRLGRDDSDSEGSSENSVVNTIKRNGVSQAVTYKSPSEMKDNIDLLNYLNYLKTKSKSSDQPILYWVDD